MIPPPPRPTLFPYTTLFRSLAVELHQNITGFEACFSRWTTIAHVGKFNATVLHLPEIRDRTEIDRKSTRLNSSHTVISYAVFCLKKKKNKQHPNQRHREKDR